MVWEEVEPARWEKVTRGRREGEQAGGQQVWLDEDRWRQVRGRCRDSDPWTNKVAPSRPILGRDSTREGDGKMSIYGSTVSRIGSGSEIENTQENDNKWDCKHMMEKKLFLRWNKAKWHKETMINETVSKDRRNVADVILSSLYPPNLNAIVI